MSSGWPPFDPTGPSGYSGLSDWDQIQGHDLTDSEQGMVRASVTAHREVGVEPTTAQIAEHTGLEPSRVERFLNTQWVAPAQIEEPTGHYASFTESGYAPSAVGNSPAGPILSTYSTLEGALGTQFGQSAEQVGFSSPGEPEIPGNSYRTPERGSTQQIGLPESSQSSSAKPGDASQTGPPQLERRTSLGGTSYVGKIPMKDGGVTGVSEDGKFLLSGRDHGTKLSHHPSPEDIEATRELLQGVKSKEKASRAITGSNRNALSGWQRKFAPDLIDAQRSANTIKGMAKLDPTRRSELTRQANETRGDEGRSNAIKRGNELRSKEGLTISASKRESAMGREARSRAAIKGNKTRGPKGRRQAIIKGHVTKGPEIRSLAVVKANKTRKAQRLASVRAQQSNSFEEGSSSRPLEFQASESVSLTSDREITNRILNLYRLGYDSARIASATGIPEQQINHIIIFNDTDTDTE
jgi:hypothetical protein